MERPAAGPLSRCNRAGARRRRRGRRDPLCADQRISRGRALGRPQLGSQSPARRWTAARRQPPPSLHCRAGVGWSQTSARARSPASSRQNWTPKGCSFPRATAKAFAWVASFCRADTAGTARCSGRHARACLGWMSSPLTVNRSTATPKTIQTCIGLLAVLDRVSSVWSPPSSCGSTHVPPFGVPACTCTRSRSPTRCSPGHARSFPRSTTGSNCRSTPGAAFRDQASTNPASRSPHRYSPTRRRRR